MLYVVATPIGNLEDITYRAVSVLNDVNVIACEDTRHTKRLLDRYEIETPSVSFHQHSLDKDLERLLQRLRAGENMALVTDAGTPCISDPGWRLVDAARSADVKVSVVPGPDAVTATLSVAGINTTAYSFLGFVPHKKGRQTFFQRIVDGGELYVMYESPHRLLKTLDWFNENASDCSFVVARELTKVYEEVVRGTASEVYENFSSRPAIKGEYVLIIDRHSS